MREDLTNHDAKQISQWLKTDVPRVVSSIEVFDKTEHVQRVVGGLQQGWQGLLLHLDAAAKAEIAQAWSGVVALVEKHHSRNSAPGLDETRKSRQYGEFVAQLDTENAELVDLLERHILTSHYVDQGSVLEAVADDENI